MKLERKIEKAMWRHANKNIGFDELKQLICTVKAVIDKHKAEKKAKKDIGFDCSPLEETRYYTMLTEDEKNQLVKNGHVVVDKPDGYEIITTPDKCKHTNTYECSTDQGTLSGTNCQEWEECEDCGAKINYKSYYKENKLHSKYFGRTYIEWGAEDLNINKELIDKLKENEKIIKEAVDGGIKTRDILKAWSGFFKCKKKKSFELFDDTFYKTLKSIAKITAQNEGHPLDFSDGYFSNYFGRLHDYTTISSKDFFKAFDKRMANYGGCGEADKKTPRAMMDEWTRGIKESHRKRIKVPIGCHIYSKDETIEMFFGRDNKKPIDKVTVTNLDTALRMCGIQLDGGLLDKIIDLVELIEEKGGKTSIKDVSKLQEDWSK